MKREDIERKASEDYPLNTNSSLAKEICYNVRLAFVRGALWAQKESNLRNIRIDTIECCKEYLSRFGTLDGVYEHYFADITEK